MTAPSRPLRELEHEVAFSLGRPQARGSSRSGARRLPPRLGWVRLLCAAGARAVRLRVRIERWHDHRSLLIYPFFRRPLDRSRFRFPPLGIAYVAAAVREAGHEVGLLDCTFLSRDEAVRVGAGDGRGRRRHLLHGHHARRRLGFARVLRGAGRLLVAGGPLPTCDPEAFVDTSTPSSVGRASRRWSNCSPRTRRAPTSAPCPAWCSGEREAETGAAAGRSRPEAIDAGAARRHVRSPPTSTRSPSRPATCCRTRSTSASGGAGTAPRSRPS